MAFRMLIVVSCFAFTPIGGVLASLDLCVLPYVSAYYIILRSSSKRGSPPPPLGGLTLYTSYCVVVYENGVSTYAAMRAPHGLKSCFFSQSS